MQVITKQVDGHKYEPFEEAVVEVPEEHVGPVVDMLGQRKGQMVDMSGGADSGSLTRSAQLCHQAVHAISASCCQLSSLDSVCTALSAVAMYQYKGY